MKKLLAILMCASLVFCASCGKKEEVKKENPVEKAVENLDKVMSENPAEVDESNISEAKKEVEALREQLQEKVGKVEEKDAEEFQNQQASVAIMQQGLDALEAAQAAGDEKAIEEAKQMIEMAKALWDLDPEQVQKEGVTIEP